jgi:TonB family protein
MRFKKASSLVVLALAFALLRPPWAAADNNVAEQLKAYYLNKVVTLRHFYKGDHLSFQADGLLVGSAEVGPWAVDSQVLVKGIELRGKSVEIQGRRVCLVFDEKAKPSRDVLAYLDESKSRDRDILKEYFLNKNVAIEIALLSENPDAQEVAAALNAILLKAGESVADVAPDCWRDYFNRIQGRPPAAPQSTEVVYRVKPGEVTPPRQTFAPEPEFSGEARASKFQGIVTVSTVVDSSGKAMDIQILSPLGLGLDEKAVDAVRGWKFEPATRQGKPVAVKIALEMDFHLN